MDPHSYYTNTPGGANLTALVSDTMKRVYLRMTLGLIVTALVALYCASSQGISDYFQAHPGMMFAVIAVWFIIGLVSGNVTRLSNGTAKLLFYVFSALTGLMLFSIFWQYSAVAIAKTFFITAGTFGAMTIYGYTTSTDLSKIGAYLRMALIGLIIAMLVNIFTQSKTFEWIISIVGVFIFVGLTAWDTQQVKQMAMIAPAESRGRLATLGALTLYLDFVNLFLFLLRIFGGSRD